MASQKGGRRSRKSRAGGGAGSRSTPRPAAGALGRPTPRVAEPAARAGGAPPKVSPRVAPQPTRRQQREERERAARDRALASRTLGTYGERPDSIFAPVPVSELAILFGLIAVVVGVIDHGIALGIGAIICGLGVLEFSAREHFSGYRSHTTLLAAFPAVVVEVLLATVVGVPKQRTLVLVPVIPVFALAFWLLRRSFAQARHARVIRPAS